MDFVVFFTVEFLIFVVGALAFGYCLLSCTSLYDSRNYQFACYLCKEMVWAKSWDRHRSECARQNEWYIDALPESPQVRHARRMAPFDQNAIKCQGDNTLWLLNREASPYVIPL